MAHNVIIQGESVLVRARRDAGARRAAHQPHPRRRLKNVRGKRAALRVEFHAKIPALGEPDDLISGLDEDDLGQHSHKDKLFSHSSISLEKSLRIRVQIAPRQVNHSTSRILAKS